MPAPTTGARRARSECTLLLGAAATQSCPHFSPASATASATCYCYWLMLLLLLACGGAGWIVLRLLPLLQRPLLLLPLEEGCQLLPLFCWQHDAMPLLHLHRCCCCCLWAAVCMQHGFPGFQSTVLAPLQPSFRGWRRRADRIFAGLHPSSTRLPARPLQQPVPLPAASGSTAVGQQRNEAAPGPCSMAHPTGQGTWAKAAACVLPSLCCPTQAHLIRPP